MTTKRRPTEISWDSDDELLNEDTAGIYAFPEERDEDVDEDALLASDEEHEEQVTSQQEEVNLEEAGDIDQYEETEEVYEEQQQQYVEEEQHYDEVEQCDDDLGMEPALEIMAEGDDLLEEEQYDEVSHCLSSEHHNVSEQFDTVQPDNREQYEEQLDNEELPEDEHIITSDQTNQVGDVSQSYSSQEVEADTTVPDSESDSEEDEDDSKARGRFKSERSNIISVSSLRSKEDIPDKLEITKEEEEKINKFQQNLRTNRNQRRPQHFPGKRGGPQFKKNQHNFQQHGPRQQFRPQNNTGPCIMQSGQRQLCMPEMLFRSNNPVALLDQSLRLVFQPPNQLRFSQANLPAQNIMGAPIMQQPLMQQQQQQQIRHQQQQQQQQQQGLLHLPSEQNIHFNPRFQSSVSRPPDIRPVWPSSQAQCVPSQSAPTRPMFNIQRPNLDQKQFQGPRMSEPWNQPQNLVLRDQRPVSLMSQSSLTTRPSLTTSQPMQPFNNVAQPLFSKPPALQLFQDQDERIQQFSAGPSAQQPTVPGMIRPQQGYQNQQHNLPQAPVNFSNNQNRFPNMVSREPQGQPIQTLVNKRPGAMGQVRIGQGHIKPSLQQNVKGVRLPGARPQHQQQQQQKLGIRPKGIVQPTRAAKPPEATQPVMQKPPSPKPMTEAEKEELQKKIKRAQRFAQPAPIVAGITKKKIILGKRLSSDSSEASKPKTLKPAQSEISAKKDGAENEAKTEKNVQDAEKKSDLELDVYLEEEKERMERMKQLAEQIKEQKRKNRLMRAKQTAQQKVQQQAGMSTDTEKAAVQRPAVRQQTANVRIPTKVTPSTQAALKNIPVGGVAKLPDGHWRKKVRVRDAATGAIKIKFIKITEQEAKQVISCGSARYKAASKPVVTERAQQAAMGQGTIRGQISAPGQGMVSSQHPTSGQSAIRVMNTSNVVNLQHNVRPIGVHANVGQNQRVVNQPSQMSSHIQPLLSQDIQRQMEPRRFVKRPGQSQQQSNANRQPLSLSSNNRSEEQGNTDKQRRVVLNSTTEMSDPSTSTVTIDGLSAGTTENKIRQLALKIGPVIACQVDRESKRAIVQFCKSQHASVFVTKYNRY